MNKLQKSALRCLNNPSGIELVSEMARSCPLLSMLILKQPEFQHLCIQMKREIYRSTKSWIPDFMLSTGFGNLLENWLINLQLSLQGLAHKHGDWVGVESGCHIDTVCPNSLSYTLINWDY